MFWNEEIETMSRADLEELQLKKLQEIVKRAFDKIPYYNKKYSEAEVYPEDIETLKDIEKLPFITSELLEVTSFTNVVSSTLWIEIVYFLSYPACDNTLIVTIDSFASSFISPSPLTDDKSLLAVALIFIFSTLVGTYSSYVKISVSKSGIRE